MHEIEPKKPVVVDISLTGRCRRSITSRQAWCCSPAGKLSVVNRQAFNALSSVGLAGICHNTLIGKDVARNTHVDSLRGVHHLGDREVGSDADQRIGIVAR